MGPTIPEREAYMLSRRHCPHTGIVNFFAAADPLLAIGSVIRAGEPARYHWRYYLGEASVGVATDMRSAENQLLGRHRDYLRAPEQAGDQPLASDRRNSAAVLAAGSRR
jgi:hypothetical protein